MSRGNFKIRPDHSEADREPTGQGSNWLSRFADSYAAQTEGKTAVEVARDRMDQIPSLHDQIHSIMNGRPLHRTVEDAVQDYQKRTGLIDYLKEAQASRQVEDAAAALISKDADNGADDNAVDLLEGLLEKLPPEALGPEGAKALEEISDPARGLEEEDVIVSDKGGEREADYRALDAVREILGLAPLEESVEMLKKQKGGELEGLESLEGGDDGDGGGDGGDADDSEKKKSPTKENLIEALEKVLDKLKEPSEKKGDEDEKEDDEEEPDIIKAVPEIAQFIENTLENSPGIHFPAVVQLIAETFGRDLSPSQLDDPVLIRYIDKRRQPPKITEYSANLGRGLGTQRDTDLFGDVQNNDPFSFGRPSSRY